MYRAGSFQFAREQRKRINAKRRPGEILTATQELGNLAAQRFTSTPRKGEMGMEVPDIEIESGREQGVIHPLA